MRATLTVTDLQKGLYWDTRELGSGPVNCVNQISVYPELRRQRVEGFGGAFTEASGVNYLKLPEEKRREFIEAYFGESGLRYALGRVHIGSCDFALGNYACMESPEDPDFHTDRDEQYLLPLIRDAQRAAGRPIGLLLSPWSPPAFMKTNGEMNHGGKLLPEYRELWASCMAKYAAFYRKAGCDVRLVSIQNEPAATQTWDSCLYSGAEEGAFAPLLRAALDREGLGDVKILAWDHNKEVLLWRAAETLSVPGAESAVDGFGVHWYTGEHFDAVRLCRERWPEKEVWFTEGCVEYSRFSQTDSVRKAEMYARDMIGNLNAGISGSMDWNLLLDAKGGPNHVGNFCEAPVMLTEDGRDFRLMGEYWYIGQISRAAAPGCVCLGVSVPTAALMAAAFENPDGTRSCVVLNPTDAPRFVSVTDNAAQGYGFTLEPHTIATVRWGTEGR